MRKMEAQAIATDSAVGRLGSNLDKNVGTTKQVRQMETLGRSARTVERDVDRLSGSSGGGGFRRLGRESDSAGGKLDRLLLRLVKFKVLMAGLKFGALATGIGVLVQAVGNLATGLTAMVPQLVGAVGAFSSMVGPLLSLGGAAAALPATFGGMAGGRVVMRLATTDLPQALKGNQAALKRLTPDARQFLDTINKQYRPMFNRLRATAQQGL